MTSLRLRSGSTTRLMPARWAASTFSLMPPTGSTVPRRVISPVIATSPRTRRPVSSDTSATVIDDARRGPVLRHGALRHVQVDVRLLEVDGDAEILDVRAHPRQTRARRLLHHVAELAGQDQGPLAGHRGGLDEEDVAAGRRPGEAGGDARDLRPLGRLRVELLRPEDVGDGSPGSGSDRRAVLGHLDRDGADDAGDLALEVAHARLARVLLDDRR